jgi:hypothetical protein
MASFPLRNEGSNGESEEEKIGKGEIKGEMLAIEIYQSFMGKKEPFQVGKKGSASPQEVDRFSLGKEKDLPALFPHSVQEINIVEVKGEAFIHPSEFLISFFSHKEAGAHRLVNFSDFLIAEIGHSIRGNELISREKVGEREEKEGKRIGKASDGRLKVSLGI